MRGVLNGSGCWQVVIVLLVGCVGTAAKPPRRATECPQQCMEQCCRSWVSPFGFCGSTVKHRTNGIDCRLCVAPPIGCERQQAHPLPVANRASELGPTRMLIDEPHKLIACYILKNGCSNLINLMFDVAERTYTQWSDLTPPLDTHHASPWASSYGKEYLEAAFGDDTFTRVLFVRSPAERLLSGFLEKCHSKSIVQRKNHCVNFRNISLPPPSFDEFVTALTPESIRWNGHFAPQSSYCGLFRNGTIDRFRFNAVVDLSHPEHQATIRRTFIDAGVDAALVDQYYPAEQVLNGGHSFGAIEKMDAYYGPADAPKANLLAKVQELYAEDYELFKVLPDVDMTAWLRPPPAA